MHERREGPGEVRGRSQQMIDTDYWRMEVER